VNVQPCKIPLPNFRAQRTEIRKRRLRPKGKEQKLNKTKGYKGYKQKDAAANPDLFTCANVYGVKTPFPASRWRFETHTIICSSG